MDHVKNFKMRMQRKYVFFDMQNFSLEKLDSNCIILQFIAKLDVQHENILDYFNPHTACRRPHAADRMPQTACRIPNSQKTYLIERAPLIPPQPVSPIRFTVGSRSRDKLTGNSSKVYSSPSIPSIPRTDPT